MGAAQQYNMINMFEALASIARTKMLITCGIFQMYSYAICYSPNFHSTWKVTMCSRPCGVQSPSYRQREWITKVGKADFDLNRQTTEIQMEESQIHVIFSSQGNTIMWQWFALWRDTGDWISVESSRKGGL